MGNPFITALAKHCFLFLLNKLPNLDMGVFEAKNGCGGSVEKPAGIVTCEPHAHSYRAALLKIDF